MRTKERRKEKKVPGKEARERKLTIPPSFFPDVNFIATSQCFTDKFVPAPDGECRLSGLPRPDEATSKKTEIRQDTRRRRQSKRSRLPFSLLFHVSTSFSFALTLTFSLLLPLSHFYFLPLLDTLSYVPSTYFSTIHPLSFLLPSRVSMRTRDPAAIPFLRFSHFNATIPIIRRARTTTPSIMAMTAAHLSLCHPCLNQPPRTFCLFAVPLPPGRTFLHRLSRVRTFEMSEEC